MTFDENDIMTAAEIGEFIAGRMMQLIGCICRSPDDSMKLIERFAESFPKEGEVSANEAYMTAIEACKSSVDEVACLARFAARARDVNMQ